jgi:hypothetical protein
MTVVFVHEVPESPAVWTDSTGSTAEQLAAAQDAGMGRAVLELYRSAKQPSMAHRGHDLPQAKARPGLALVASEDDAAGSRYQRETAAARAGAQVEVLEGVNHFWMAQNPSAAAAVLTRFWGSAVHE